MKEQLKKLSDLKENEFVNVFSKSEMLRISGKRLTISKEGCYINTNEIFGILEVRINLCLVYPSSMIADYKEPVPTRPATLLSYAGTLKALDDISKLNKYCNHLESKITELEKNVFVPFDAKASFGYTGIKKGKKYTVLLEHDGCYVFVNDFGKIDYCNKFSFTKI